MGSLKQVRQPGRTTESWIKPPAESQIPWAKSCNCYVSIENPILGAFQGLMLSLQVAKSNHGDILLFLTRSTHDSNGLLELRCHEWSAAFTQLLRSWCRKGGLSRVDPCQSAPEFKSVREIKCSSASEREPGKDINRVWRIW
jgi:hypothetical protein